jgi:hypothetical protein
MYISTVSFEERNDAPDVMVVDENYMTPVLKTAE